MNMFFVGVEEQGSMAEASYYSYEYDPDSELFLTDGDGADIFDVPDVGAGVEHKLLLPVDPYLPATDTKTTPERW